MARRGHSNSDYLFATYDWQSVQDSYREKLKRQIDDADASAVQDGSVDEATERFVAEFRLELPELIEGAVSADIEETQVDVTGDFNYGHFGRGPNYVPGIRASYFVPFRGEPDMFKVSPTMWSSVHPAAEITDSELRFVFERPGQPVDETKKAFDDELSRVKQNLQRLQTNVTEYNNGLLPLARERIAARRTRLEGIQRGGSSLGIPIRKAGQAAPAPPSKARAGADAASKSPNRPAPMYDVSLSFAGEDRAYVDEVARSLRAAGVEVFYDSFERANLWGKNLIDHLAEIYKNKSRYVVMFISQHYVAKGWPNHERQHAQERAFLAREEYILPARFDDTDVPGMANTVGHVDLRKVKPAEFVDLILTKLGKK